MKKFTIKDITILALFIALGVVLKIYSIPVFNAIAKIEFFKISVIMAACLYGPVSAGIAAGAIDMLAYLLLQQSNPYNPVITLVYILGGVLAGIIFKYLNKSGDHGLLFKMILTVYIPGLIVCLLNSFIILYLFFGNNPLIPFFAIRFSVEIVIDIIVVYFIKIIYPIIMKRGNFSA